MLIFLRAHFPSLHQGLEAEFADLLMLHQVLGYHFQLVAVCFQNLTGTARKPLSMMRRIS